MIRLHSHSYEANILEERGGNCIRLAIDGIEALRTPDTLTDFDTENPYLYGMPLLYPPNRISDGWFTFQERKHLFPINEPAIGCFLHGELHRTPFQVIEQSSKYVQLQYQATTQQPYMTFPHAFTLTLAYRLNMDGLHQQATFTNDSKQDMPVALALHNIPTSFCS